MESDYEIIELLFNLEYQEIDPKYHRLDKFTEEELSPALFEKHYTDVKIEILINAYYLLTPKVLIFKNERCIYNEYMSAKDLEKVIKKLNRDIILDLLD